MPEDTFTPEEEVLRRVIVSYMQNRASHVSPAVSKIAENPTVVKAVANLHLPPAHLEGWISERMGGEVSIAYDAKQLPFLRLETPAELPPRGTEKPASRQGEFFSSLPADLFSEEEEVLRVAIHNFLSTWAGPVPPTLAIIAQHPTVLPARRAFLPNDVSLREWCDTRLGAEIELTETPSGQYTVWFCPYFEPAAATN